MNYIRTNTVCTLVEYCTYIFGVSHHQCHGEVNGVDCSTSLFGVSYCQFHSEINSIDYCTSLFGVSHHPLQEVEQRRLLHMLY